MSASDWVMAPLLVLGCALFALAGIGVLRLPDAFGRMHAATKASTLGFVFVAVGAAVGVGQTAATGKLLLTVAFLFVTAPAAAHVMGRAAHRSGTELGAGTVRDDLGQARLDDTD